jgi:hypothetical protein
MISRHWPLGLRQRLLAQHVVSRLLPRLCRWSHSPTDDSWLYPFPFAGFFSWPMAAVALGIAQGALDVITEKEGMRVVPDVSLNVHDVDKAKYTASM